MSVSANTTVSISPASTPCPQCFELHGPTFPLTIGSTRLCDCTAMKVYEPSLIGQGPIRLLVRAERADCDGSSASWARRRRPPAPISGGITNRNYRLRLGGRDCVLRLPGRDTSCSASTALRSGSRPNGRRASGSVPSCCMQTRDCAVTAFVPGDRVEPGDLRADPGPVARALRAFHDSGLELPVRFWIPDLLSDYAQTVRERAGAAARRVRGAPGRWSSGSPQCCRSTIRCRATTICWPAT